MKLIVTGGAGYIGSVVGSHLLAAGHSVTVVDDLSTGHRDAVPDGADFLTASVLDAYALAPVLAGADGVLHFAAKSLVGESVEKPEIHQRRRVADPARVDGAGRRTPRGLFLDGGHLWRAAERADPRRCGDHSDQPLRRLQARRRRHVRDMSAARGLSAVSLRYFNVAGASGCYGERHTTET